MKTFKNTKSWILGAALIVAAQGTSQAGLSQFNIFYYGGYGENLTVQGVAHSTLATAFAADWVGGAALPPNHSDPFVTFCLDINANIANGSWQSGGYADVSLTSQSSPAIRQAGSLYRVANLYATFAGGIMPVGGNWSLATTAQKIEGGALQLAIWEVLYEPVANGYNVLTTVGSTGLNVTSVNSAISTRANQMLAAASSQNLSLTSTFWNAVNADGSRRNSQDLVGPFAPVPESGTFIAGGLLLLPFLASTLRRKFAK